ncbi:hypothetical protein Cfor_06612 [Coptotermes formosanus]|uniref:Uncharacterized protein n=1 Tax=Coptotermes formosanus TaxID=36987 RepID=A0A6L2PI36_COPFO|nr:hypothetical protein Cfor_06612 [Coptotermes formosanus]
MPLFGTLVTLTRYCTTEAQYEVAEVGELFIVQGLKNPSMYSIPSKCGQVYTGQTAQSETRVHEHYCTSVLDKCVSMQ